MDGQIALFPEMEKKEPNSCNNCENYSELREPRLLRDNFYIYGYCFKNRSYNDKGYAVYIPEACCKTHKPLKI